MMDESISGNMIDKQLQGYLVRMREAFAGIKLADAEMRDLVGTVTKNEQMIELWLVHAQLAKEAFTNCEELMNFLKDKSSPVIDELKVLLAERHAWDKETAAFWEAHRIKLLQ